MASPSVVSSAITEASSATSTPTVNLPSSITSGNTLIALFRSAQGGAIGWPAGWTELVDASADPSADQQAIAWRKADGEEGSTISLTSGNAKFAAIVWEISGATDPTVTAPEISTVATGDSNLPDPTTVTPTGGSKDYLFLWLGGWEGKHTSPPLGNPTNYSGPVGAKTLAGGGTASHCAVAGAYYQNTAASEDPGSWLISNAQAWSAYALAIHPGAAGPQTASVVAATASSDAPVVTRTPGGLTRGVAAATSTANAAAVAVKNISRVIVSTASTTGDVPAATRSPGAATRQVAAADGSSDSAPLDGASPGVVTRSVVAADALADPPAAVASTGGLGVVQTKSEEGSKTATFDSNTVAGNSIVVVIGSVQDEVTDVSDDNSNIYVKIASNTSAVRFISIWLASDITGGATTSVTTTSADGDSGSHLVIAELRGELELDQANTNDSTVTIFHHGGGITTAHDDTIVIMGTRIYDDFTVSSRSESYVQLGTTNRVEAQYKVYSSTTTTDADWTSGTSESGGNAMVSLNEVGIGPQIAAVVAASAAADAPAVARSPGAVTRSVVAASAAADAPAVARSPGAVTRSVVAAPATTDAPAVARSPSAVTRSVAAATSIADAPAAARSSGVAIRSVAAATSTADAPTATASTTGGPTTRSVAAATSTADVPTTGRSSGVVARSVVAADAVTDAPIAAASTAGSPITRSVAAAASVADAPAAARSPGVVARSVAAATSIADAPVVARSSGVATRSVAAATSTANAPAVVVPADEDPIVGEVEGQGEAAAAVGGTGETIAAVSGTGETIVAVAGTAEAYAAVAGRG